MPIKIDFTTLKAKISKSSLIVLLVSLLLFAGFFLIQNLVLEKKGKLPPFFLSKTEPPAGAHRTPFPASAITFIFSEKVSPLSVSYSVSPLIELAWKFGDNQNTLQFYPLTPWQPNQEYKLVISKELRSPSGQKLKEDIIYLYKLTPPQDYPAW